MVAAALALTACSGQTSGGGEQSAEDAPASAAVTWTAKVTPASMPTVVGGTPVLHTVQDGHLMITGLDAKTGATLWSHKATPSEAMRALALRVPVIDDKVVHLEPAPGATGPDAALLARTVVRDPKTGKALSTSRAAVHYRLPRACPGDPGTVCGFTREGDKVNPIQRLTDKGTFARIGDQEYQRFSGTLGQPDLYRINGQELGRLGKDSVLWKTTAAALAGPGASSNTGWTFLNFPEAGIIAGTLGTTDDANSLVRDETERALFGADAKTGKRLWMLRSMSASCDPVRPGSDKDAPLLACEIHSGKMRLAPNEVTTEDLRYDLVRVQPSDGKVLWRVPMTPDGPVTVKGHLQGAALDEHHVRLADTVVDVRDGSSRAATDADAPWSAVRDPIALTAPALAKEIAYVLPGLVVNLPKGKDLSGATPAWPLPPAIGAALDDGSRVVSLPDQVVRFSPR